MERAIIFMTALLLVACDDGSSKSPTDTNTGTQDNDPDTSADPDTGTDSGGDVDTMWGPAWAVFSTSCGAAGTCHNSATSGAEGLDLPADDEAASRENAAAFSAKIKEAVTTRLMPRGGSLTEDEIQAVVDWIDSL